MLKLGRVQSLPLLRTDATHAYLDGGVDGEVLLPLAQLKAESEPGEKLKVFVFQDHEQGLCATTQRPKAQVGQCAMLQVKQINRVGIFMDWGLDKDLFVPFSQQQQPMQEGHSYLVYLYLDNEQRVVGSAKLDRFIADPDGQYKPGQKVKALCAGRTDLGFKMILQGEHWGLLYHDQVQGRLRAGESMELYVQHVRDDGKVDLRLKESAYKQALDITDQILAKLAEEDGYLAMSDKSPPQLISAVFGVSKGTFKKAIGHLYKQGKIKLSKHGIALNKD